MGDRDALLPQQRGESAADNQASFKADNFRYLHVGFTILQIFATLTSVFMCAWLIGDVFSTSPKFVDKSALTSTFYSSSDFDSSVGWPLSTKQILVNEGFSSSLKKTWNWNHYYECLSEAHYGETLCPQQVTQTLDQYLTCLQNNSVTQAALTTCSAFSGTYFYQWPSKDQYLRCLTSQPQMLASKNQRSVTNTLKNCLNRIDWPIFENVQGVDSELFLGSYNWPVLCLVGLLIMTSFSVFTTSPVENMVKEHDEPGLFSKMGLFSSAVSLIWNLTFFCVFLGYMFKVGGATGTFTVWTAVIVVIFMSVAVFYFVDEVSSAWFFKNFFKHDSYEKAKGTRYQHAMSMLPQGGAKSTVGMYVLNPDHAYRKHAHLIDEVYTPPLISTWSDGYFADALILVGLAGATGQVTTDQAWGLFIGCTLFRMVNMAIARCLYESFLVTPDDTEVTQNYKRDKTVWGNAFQNAWMVWGGGWQTKGDEPYLDLKVVALAMQIAGVYLFGAVYILANTDWFNSVERFRTFFTLAFTVPEVIRATAHITCQVFSSNRHLLWLLLLSHEFLWVWDLSVRLIYVTIALWEDNNNMGSRSFLSRQIVAVPGSLLSNVTYLGFPQ